MTRKQSIHKAVTSLIGSLVTIAGIVFNQDIGIGPELIGAIGTMVTTVLVWAIPNKEKT